MPLTIFQVAVRFSKKKLYSVLFLRIRSFQNAFLAMVMALCTITGSAQSVVKSSVTANAASGSVAVNKPTGTVEGDLLVACLTFNTGSSATLTVPTGWTLIARTNQTTTVGLATYYRVAGASEAASYTWGSSSRWTIGIIRISGANTTTPIQVSAANSSGTASTSVGAPAVTTTAANSLVLAFYTNNNISTYTAATGTFEQYDAPYSATSPSNMLATFIKDVAGSTGTLTATSSNSAAWAAQQVAINPSTNLIFNSSGSLLSVKWIILL